MKRLIIIFSFAAFLLAFAGQQAYGQLITDSDSRLKTEKKKNKDGGFLFFKGKKGGISEHGAGDQKAQVNYPRYSSGSPFASFNKRKASSPRSATSSRSSMFARQRYTTPRYSSGSLAGMMSSQRKPIRYSAGMPFSGKEKFITPRFSTGSPFEQSFFAQLFRSSSGGYPRYSSGSPFGNRVSKVIPKYSSGSPFRNKPALSSPRYSSGSPFGNKLSRVSPKYSIGSPFGNRQMNISPKYSSGSPFGNKISRVSPKYSSGSPFGKKQMTVSPKYSSGSPFGNKQMNVSPKYSVGSPYAGMNWDWIKPAYTKLKDKDRFYVNERIKNTPREDMSDVEFSGFSRKQKKWYKDLNDISWSGTLADFEGPVRMPLYWPLETREQNEYKGDFKRKWVNSHKMHPSANYRYANQDSEVIRESLRKWNIFWTRVNRNKEQPDAVTDKISKPKFDRKEAEIWND